MKRKVLLFAVFFLSLGMFIYETAQAVGVVAFHADFFRKKGVIVLDAGHGGEDGGAQTDDGVLEKDINLAVARALKKDLEQAFFEVIMVRDGDYAVGDGSLPTVAARKRSDLHRRLQIVEEAGDCILLSIHQNRFSDPQYSGAQMFYGPQNGESAALAEAIRQSVRDALDPDNTRDSRPAGENIFLLSNVRVPAVLVECGFLSNPGEAQKLCSEQYQKDMAAAIYNGLIAYLEEKRTGAGP